MSKYVATFRFRNADTGDSICAAVLKSDPTNIRYGFDLLQERVILSEDDFFDSILSKLENTVPFTQGTKQFLMNRAMFLLSERRESKNSGD